MKHWEHVEDEKSFIRVSKLSHSSNIYNEIRQYLKQEVVELSQVQLMIDRACPIPEHKGEVCKEDLLALYLNAYLQKLTLLKGAYYETLA